MDNMCRYGWHRGLWPHLQTWPLTCGNSFHSLLSSSDARHLAWLRDETGDAFAAGIILHTGPHVFPVSDRIIAAPVSALWS